jgi:hypothetical protein
VVGRSEQRVDERRDRGTLCQDQQNSEDDQRNHDRRQPILLVFSHELPEFTDDLSFRHAALLIKVDVGHSPSLSGVSCQAEPAIVLDDVTS